MQQNRGMITQEFKAKKSAQPTCLALVGDCPNPY